MKAPVQYSLESWDLKRPGFRNPKSKIKVPRNTVQVPPCHKQRRMITPVQYSGESRKKTWILNLDFESKMDS